MLQLKGAVRKSFTVIYASLKARELKTLRQLDAIRKQWQNNKDLKTNCVQNIHISYDNESSLLDNINKYGVLDLEKLNFASDTFTIEDYVCPDDDHMYSYKCIEDLTKDDNDQSAIEEAALKQVTNSDCVCYVNIRSEDVSRQFREEVRSPVETTCDSSVSIVENVQELSVDSLEIVADEKSECSDPEAKKVDPTDDWLNIIKNQTETEPSQSNDVMEHSRIVCT